MDRDQVRSSLADALLALDQEDMAHRAGRTRSGYVAPTEAAWQLLDEAFEPWIEDVERRARLELTDAARELALAILDGLAVVAASRENDWLLISWVPAFVEEATGQVHSALRRAGISVPELELDVDLA